MDGAGEVEKATVESAIQPAIENNPSRSSHGSMSDDTRITEKVEVEGLPVTPAKDQGSEEGALDLAKLDSKVVTVKEDNDDPFRHLPEIEANILRRQVAVPVVKVGIKELFRYATRNDKIIIAISFVCAIAGGAALPLMTVRSLDYPRSITLF